MIGAAYDAEVHRGSADGIALNAASERQVVKNTGRPTTGASVDLFQIRATISYSVAGSRVEEDTVAPPLRRTMSEIFGNVLDNYIV